MNQNLNKSKITEANLVVRHLKMDNATQQYITHAKTEVERLDGFLTVLFDETSQAIIFSYDASLISIEIIENILNENGLEVRHDWWTNLKKGYYRFVDKNIKDNSSLVPHCCSKPPIGANRKKH